MADTIKPTQVERFFDTKDIIVSKTDLKGRITYANHTFLEIAGYREDEVVGQPHRMIRHPDMPRSIYKVLWDSILDGREVFAYVKNMTKCGDHYWVLAHVTPSVRANGEVVGFHSNRRVPKRTALDTIVPLYDELSQVEAKQKNGKDAVAAGYQHLQDYVTKKGLSYEEYVLAL